MTGTQVSFKIYGVVPSLKNSRDIGQRPDPYTGKMRMFPTRNPDIVHYQRDFADQLPASCRLELEGKFSVTILAWYPDWRRDMDVEIIYDLLQSCRVIENDRFITEKHVYRDIDKRNPRIAVRVEVIGPRPVKKTKKRA